mgnify:CR=1 FL=1
MLVELRWYLSRRELPILSSVSGNAAAEAAADAATTRSSRTVAPGLTVDDMLAMPNLDLVVDILPHNLHAPTALQCLNAGKHVFVEKPLCITRDELRQIADCVEGLGADCPILMVSGRTYPVEVRYRPLQSEDPDEEDMHMEEAILRANNTPYGLSGGVWTDKGAKPCAWRIPASPCSGLCSPT